MALDPTKQLNRFDTLCRAEDVSEEAGIPQDVETLQDLAPTQVEGFWLRELCMQIAALREELQEEWAQINRQRRAER